MTNGTSPVHDLADATGGRGAAGAADRGAGSRGAGGRNAGGRDAGGAASALLGAAALVVAGVPGGGALPHWAIGLGLGALSLLAALGALRRARRLRLVLLPLAAVLLTGLAVVALVLRAHDPVDPGAATVALPASAQLGSTGVATVTGRGDDRALVGALDGLLEQLHLVRGTEGPYPGALAQAGDDVVVADGIARGAVIATLPAGTRLSYGITPDHGYFRVTLTAPGAVLLAVTGDSTVGAGAVNAGTVGTGGP